MTQDKLRILGATYDKLLAGPKTIYIDILTPCNIKCNFCWFYSPLRKKPFHKKPSILDFKDIQAIIDQAADWGTTAIIISGDGEPTLHPKIDKIIDHISKQNLTVSMTTNATFKEELIPAIAKFTYLCINLSAPNEKLYNQIMSPNNKTIYKRVIRNLEILSKLGRKLQKPVLEIAYIINSTNYDAIPQIFELANGLNIERIIFRMMEPIKQTKGLLLSTSQKKHFLDIIDKLLKDDISVKHNLHKIRSGLVDHAKSPFHLNSCFTGWLNLYVSFNKDVGICCHNVELIIGNMENASLEQIWHGEKAQELRLQGKYQFDITKPPFKNECEWCHAERQNNKVEEYVKNGIKSTIDIANQDENC